MSLSDEEFDKAEDARLNDPIARLREILDEVDAREYRSQEPSEAIRAVARVLREMLKERDHYANPENPIKMSWPAGIDMVIARGLDTPSGETPATDSRNEPGGELNPARARRRKEGE